MNAPGRFQDVRERPVADRRPGVTRLAEIAPGAVFLPLALEYVFWTRARPEMLAAFGPPIARRRPGRRWTATRGRRRSRDALTATMDRLAADAITRDAARFHTVVRGRGEGMGGLYDLVAPRPRRAARAALRPAARAATPPGQTARARLRLAAACWPTLPAAHGRAEPARCCRRRAGQRRPARCVSILIPARDEAANIGACLDAALRQHGRGGRGAW